MRADRGLSGRGRTTVVAAFVLAACRPPVAGLLGSSAGAATASKTTVVLGSTATEPDPSCPALPCQAVGSVTGFQVSNNQAQLPFRVTKRGRVKSWTLTLAQPTNSQRSFFNGFFGTPPEARLAVLRRIAGTSPPRFNLRSQGSIHVLSPYLGQTVRFGASLRVQRGDIIGITVPTWAPAFAQGLERRKRVAREPRAAASARTRPTCARASPSSASTGARPTAVKYSTARLLYTVTIVED